MEKKIDDKADSHNQASTDAGLASNLSRREEKAPARVTETTGSATATGEDPVAYSTATTAAHDSTEHNNPVVLGMGAPVGTGEGAARESSASVSKAPASVSDAGRSQSVMSSEPSTDMHVAKAPAAQGGAITSPKTGASGLLSRFTEKL